MWDCKTWSDIKNSYVIRNPIIDLPEEKPGLLLSSVSVNTILDSQRGWTRMRVIGTVLGDEEKGDGDLRDLYLFFSHCCNPHVQRLASLSYPWKLTLWTYGPFCPPSLHLYHEAMSNIRNGSIKTQDFPSM